MRAIVSIFVLEKGMTDSKKGVVVNLNGQRAVLRVFCPSCKSEYNIEVLEKCAVQLRCENCGNEEIRCIFHLIYDEKFRGRVRTEKVAEGETLREVFLTMPT